METISFYSYKGGVGRTWLVANMARYLARLGKRVMVADFDLEAPGLHYKFDWPEGASSGPGLVDLLNQIIQEQKFPDSLSPFIKEIPAQSPEAQPVRVLTAGDAPSKEYWQKFQQIDWRWMFREEEGQGVPIFLELKARVEQEFQLDYLLIDSRTGITDMGGVATSLLADKVVLLFLDNREHLDGTKVVLNHILAPDTSTSPKIILVHTRAPDEDEAAEAAKINALKNLLPGASVLVLTLREDKNFQKKSKLLVGSEERPHGSALLEDYLKLSWSLMGTEAFKASTRQLLEQIKGRIFKDVDGTEKSLELMALYCPSEETLEALATIYKIRNRSYSHFQKIIDSIKIIDQDRTIKAHRIYKIFAPIFMQSEDFGKFHSSFLEEKHFDRGYIRTPEGLALSLTMLSTMTKLNELGHGRESYAKIENILKNQTTVRAFRAMIGTYYKDNIESMCEIHEAKNINSPSIWKEQFAHTLLNVATQVALENREHLFIFLSFADRDGVPKDYIVNTIKKHASKFPIEEVVRFLTKYETPPASQ